MKANLAAVLASVILGSGVAYARTAVVCNRNSQMVEILKIENKRPTVDGNVQVSLIAYHGRTSFSFGDSIEIGNSNRIPRIVSAISELLSSTKITVDNVPGNPLEVQRILDDPNGARISLDSLKQSCVDIQSLQPTVRS